MGRLAGVDPGLVVTVVALVAFPFAREWDRWFAVLLLATALYEVRAGNVPVASLAVFATCLVGVASVSRLMMLWPLPLAAAAAALAMVARLVPSMRSAFAFAQRGRLDAGVGFAIAASVVVAGLALVGWFALARPDYGAVRAQLFPALPVPLLALGIVLFAIANAALEELAYRGVLLAALDAEVGVGVLALAVQAVAFGAMHVNGFPRGAAGVALATIYGLMMGIVRRRADGLLAPFIGHVLTDVVIGTILLVTG